MNKVMSGALVAAIGLALGFGAAWLWDGITSPASEGTATADTPAPASS